MPKKKKKKDIIVSAALFKRSVDPVRVDTTGMEALKVSEFSGKTGEYLSYLKMVIGIFLIFSAGIIFTSTQFLFSTPLLICFLALIGALNVLCGLMLLSKE